jgi:translation elongation factor EF-Ts
MATKHAARDLAQLSGHSEADCRDVLAQCDGDIDRAVDKLLNSAYPRDATRHTRPDASSSVHRVVGEASAPTFSKCRKFFLCVWGGSFFEL